MLWGKFYVFIVLLKFSYYGYIAFRLVISVLYYCSINTITKGIRKVGLKTGKTVSTMRAFKTVSDQKMRQLKTKWMKKRTFNKMLWGVRAFNEWRLSKLGVNHSSEKFIRDTDLDDVVNVEKEGLISALCKFIPEVMKVRDGTDYPGKTLYELVVSIQKYLNNNGKPWKLIEGPEFVEVRTVLDNVMKERAIQNLGMVRKQAQFMSLNFENSLWEKGLLGEETPDKLRETVLFLLGMNLLLRAGDEHYDLRRDSASKPSQLSFERDEKGTRCLVYREDTVTKTNDGG